MQVMKVLEKLRIKLNVLRETVKRRLNWDSATGTRTMPLRLPVLQK